MWYKSDASNMKMIMFILAKAQTPLTLYGGKLFVLSANSFTMV